jgi:hypothetical protein
MCPLDVDYEAVGIQSLGNERRIDDQRRPMQGLRRSKYGATE